MDHITSTNSDKGISEHIFIEAFRERQMVAHGISRSHGFWDKPRNKGESFALIHSEISEALEGTRGFKR